MTNDFSQAVRSRNKPVTLNTEVGAKKEGGSKGDKIRKGHCPFGPAEYRQAKIILRVTKIVQQVSQKGAILDRDIFLLASL